MRALLIVGIAVATGLAVAEEGRSCSMAASRFPTEPRALVAEAGAAFTGTLVAVRPKEPSPRAFPAPYVFTFAVEQWHKGDPGEQVVEAVNWQGGACGQIEATIGRHGSYLLTRTADDWAVSEIGSELLRRGLRPWPRPNGSGPAAFVAGGNFGFLRTALLDARGRTLAYGVGRGAVTALSVCPGQRAFAELVRIGESVHLAVRELPSMRLLRDAQLRRAGYGDTVVCTSRTGADAVATVLIYGHAQVETELVRVTSVGTRILAHAPRLAMTLRDKVVVVSRSDGQLLLLDLARGRSRKLLDTLPLTGMSLSPEGRYVAGVAGETLVLVDVLRRTVTTAPSDTAASQTRWLARGKLAAWSSATGGLEIVNQRLDTLVPAWTWKAQTTTVRGSTLYGVDRTGRFITQRAGRNVPLGTVFSPAVSVLEPIEPR
jgi:hypothetical protein